MSGASIIADLLRGNPAVTAVVAAANIKAGRLADGAAMPTLLIRTISSVEGLTLVREDFVRNTDRVAVTVRAAAYRDQAEVIKLVKACCAGVTGSVASYENVVIDNAGLGPDINGPGDTFEQTQDFRVSYDEPV